jgi:hypothetical protein
MKTLMTYMLGCWLFIAGIPVLNSQDFEIRMMQDDFDYIAVQMRETSGTGTPSASNDFMDLQFEIRWDTSYGTDLDVGLICSRYYLIDGLGSRQRDGRFYWRVFAADSVPFHSGSGWVTGQWETVGQFKAIWPLSEDTASFAVAKYDWVIQGLNINVDGIDYPISRGDSLANYLIPTLVYEYVWKGGASPAKGYDQNSWTYGLNWENECRDRYDTLDLPYYGSRCIIPSGLTYYPTNFNNYTDCFSRILKMNNNSYLEIPSGKRLWINTDLNVDPGAQIKVIDGAELRVEQPD